MWKWWYTKYQCICPLYWRKNQEIWLVYDKWRVYSDCHVCKKELWKNWWMTWQKYLLAYIFLIHGCYTGNFKICLPLLLINKICLEDETCLYNISNKRTELIIRYSKINVMLHHSSTITRSHVNLSENLIRWLLVIYTYQNMVFTISK